MRGCTFSQGYSLYCFSFLLLYGGLKLGSWIGFSRLSFSVDGVRGLWCGGFRVFLRLGLSI